MYGSSSNGGAGVVGESEAGTGVDAQGGTSVGVRSQAASYGVLAESVGGGVSVRGDSTFGTGIQGHSYSGHAGYFQGRVYVSGYLQKAGGGFKIDHPLDPANKCLVIP